MVTVDKDLRPDCGVTRRSASAGSWWCRGHRGFLASLLLLNIVVDGLAFRTQGTTGLFFWTGILLAQTFLLGVWMALGGLHGVLRGILVGAATTGGALAVTLAVSQGDPDLLEFFLPWGGTIVLATYVLLLPLRLLLCWRVDFDEAYHTRRSYDRMQLGLADCIDVLTAFALLLGCARWLDREYLPMATAGGGLALLNSWPIALVIVRRRPSVAFWLLVAAGFGVSLAAEYVVATFILNAPLGLFFPFEFGLVATLLLNLLPLRFIFGLHLFSVAAGTAPELDRALAEVKAAWPTLPETIRARIVTLARSAGATEERTKNNFSTLWIDLL